MSGALAIERVFLENAMEESLYMYGISALQIHSLQLYLSFSYLGQGFEAIKFFIEIIEKNIEIQVLCLTD